MRAFSLLALAAVSSFGIGCEGPMGATGPEGQRGLQGESGEQGEPGEPGQEGQPGEPGQQGEPGLAVLDEFPLPGDHFYPEGIAAAADGTLYVGSVGTGVIVRKLPSEVRPTPFVASDPGRPSIVGMMVDDAAGVLWACTQDFTFETPSTLASFDLATGAPLDSYPLEAGGFCNDLAFDGAGNIYLTDTNLSKLDRLPAGGDAIEVWSEDPAYPESPGDFTVNGIAWDGGTNIYTVKYVTGELFRVPIEADGSAGAPVAVDVDLAGGDGLKAIDADTLIVVEGTRNALTRVELDGDTGSTATIANRFDFPTTFAIVGDSVWVVEGQLDHLLGLDPSPPFVPFLVRRVYLQ